MIWGSVTAVGKTISFCLIDWNVYVYLIVKQPTIKFDLFDLGSLNVVLGSVLRTRIRTSKRTGIESIGNYRCWYGDTGIRLYLKTTPNRHVRSSGRRLNGVLKMKIIWSVRTTATNPRGDSKMDVVELVPSYFVQVWNELVWMNVWHGISNSHIRWFSQTYIYLMAENVTSFSLTPFLETYELSGYMFEKVNSDWRIWQSGIRNWMWCAILKR